MSLLLASGAPPPAPVAFFVLQPPPPPWSWQTPYDVRYDSRFPFPVIAAVPFFVLQPQQRSWFETVDEARRPAIDFRPFVPQIGLNLVMQTERWHWVAAEEFRRVSEIEFPRNFFPQVGLNLAMQGERWHRITAEEFRRVSEIEFPRNFFPQNGLSVGMRIEARRRDEEPFTTPTSIQVFDPFFNRTTTAVVPFFVLAQNQYAWQEAPAFRPAGDGWADFRPFWTQPPAPFFVYNPREPDPISAELFRAVSPDVGAAFFPFYPQNPPPPPPPPAVVIEWLMQYRRRGRR